MQDRLITSNSWLRLLLKHFTFNAFIVLNLIVATLTCQTALASPRHRIVQSDNVKLWTEHFGRESFPAVLLIMGAGASGIFWPDQFCDFLAKDGFFIIRYDHRDTGRSSSIDYDKDPYTIHHLTQDALAILDAYNIDAAHVVGFSMGGEIAQFMGAYHPDRVKSLTLIATSTDMQPGFNALEGKKHAATDLSTPKPEYVKWVTRKVDPAHQTMEDKIKDTLHTWRMLNGSEHGFDEKLYQDLIVTNMSISKNQNENPYLNHAKAMKASFADHHKTPSLIKLPTLIIHGTLDPVFGMDHATALKNTIPKAKLAHIQNMGHCLLPCYYSQILPLIYEQVSTHNTD